MEGKQIKRENMKGEQLDSVAHSVCLVSYTQKTPVGLNFHCIILSDMIILTPFTPEHFSSLGARTI